MASSRASRALLAIVAAIFAAAAVFVRAFVEAPSAASGAIVGGQRVPGLRHAASHGGVAQRTYTSRACAEEASPASPAAPHEESNSEAKKPRPVAGVPVPPDLLRSIPAGLPETAGNTPKVKGLRETAVFFNKVVVGGQVAQEFTPAEDLWRNAGALFVAVRRPGCWLSREQAWALGEIFVRATTSRDQASKPGLIAIVRNSIDNEDGSNEVDAFRDYFPGDVYVDPYLSIFKALGDRQFVDGVFSQENARWMLQRVVGTKAKKVAGNFVGGPDVALKFGGCMVVDRSGELRFSHQEGVGFIDYPALEQVLGEI